MRARNGPERPLPPVRAGDGYARKVLILHDDASMAFWLVHLLEREGFEVSTPALDVKAALALIDEDVPDAAILALDLGAGRTSQQVAAELDAYGVPFVMIAEHASLRVMCRGTVSSTLLEPIDDRDVVTILSRMLEAVIG